MAQGERVVFLIGADSSEAIREFDRVRTEATRLGQDLRSAGPRGGLLDAFGREVRSLPDALTPASAAARGFGEAVGGAEVGLHRAGLGVHSLATPLKLLSRGMEETSSEGVRLIAHAAHLGLGFGGAAVAAAGLATVLVGPLVAAWKRSSDSVKEYQETLNSLDLGKVQTKIDANVKRLAEVNKEITELQARLARAGEAPTLGTGGPRGTGGGGLGLLGGLGLRTAERERGELQRQLGGLHLERRVIEEDVSLAGPEARAAAEKAQAQVNAQLAQEALQLDQEKLNNRLKVIEVEKTIATARLSALRQIVDAEGQETLSVQQRFGLQQALIEQTKAVELRAIAETAAARKQQIGLSGAAPELQAEQRLQIDRDVAAQRRQIEDKVQLEIFQNAQRFLDSRRQQEEQLFQIRRQLGEATLQDEIRRAQAIADAAEAGSKRQIDALQRVAAAQAQLRVESQAFLQKFLTDKFTAPTGQTAPSLTGAAPAAQPPGQPAAEKPGIFGDVMKGIRASDLTLNQFDLAEKVRKAQIAQDVFQRGGTITPAEMKDVLDLPNLQKQATGDPFDLFLSATGQKTRGFDLASINPPRSPGERRLETITRGPDQVGPEDELGIGSVAQSFSIAASGAGRRGVQAGANLDARRDRRDHQRDHGHSEAPRRGQPGEGRDQGHRRCRAGPRQGYL
jgi:hypothetical protein